MRTFEQLQAELAANKQLEATRPIREANALNALPAQGNQATQAEAAVRGAAQGFTLGASDEIQAGAKTAMNMIQGKSTSYEKELAAVRAQEKLAAQQWPKTAALSNIAGGAATSLIPGLGIAKGASVLGTAAKMAAIGGTAGFLGGEGQEDRLRKAGVGAGIGAVAGAVSGVLSKGANAAANVDDAAVGAAKSLGANADTANEIGEAYARTIAKNAGEPSVKVNAKDGLRAFGQDLLDKGYIKPGQGIQQIKEKVAQDLDEAGEALGGYLQRLDQSSQKPVIRAEAVLGKLQKLIGKQAPDLTDDTAAAMIKQRPLPGSILENSSEKEAINAALAPRIRAFVGEFIEPALAEGRTPRMTLGQLQAFRQSLAKEIYSKDNSKATIAALEKVERFFADQLEEGVRAVGGAKDQAVFQQLKRQVQFLSLANRAASQGAKRMENLTQGSMVSTISSALGGVGGAVATGGNPAGIIAGAVGTATIAPSVISRAPSTIAASRAGLANVLSSPAAQATGQAAGLAGRGALQSLFTGQ